MIQTLVVTLMWARVASLLIFRRKRTDRSVTYAALAIAIAMTLNVDGIYAAVDPFLGSTNSTTLIADALLMTGLFFLGRGVMKSGEYRPRLSAPQSAHPSRSSHCSRSPHRSCSSTAAPLRHDSWATWAHSQQQRCTRSSTSAMEHSSSRRCSSSQLGSFGTAPASSGSPPRC